MALAGLPFLLGLIFSAALSYRYGDRVVWPILVGLVISIIYALVLDWWQNRANGGGRVARFSVWLITRFVKDDRRSVRVVKRALTVNQIAKDMTKADKQYCRANKVEYVEPPDDHHAR